MTAININTERDDHRVRAIVTFDGDEPVEGVIVNVMAPAIGCEDERARVIDAARNGHFDELVRCLVWERAKAYPGMVYVYDALVADESTQVRVEVSAWAGGLIEAGVAA